ncbi:MAG: MarR family transcriptional regulator [Sphingomonadales bacterium]|nr:MarR family transcriptional regulator [Sphingomonadales bacterium]
MRDSHSDPIRLLDAVSRLHGRLREAFAAARLNTGLNEMEHTVLAAVTEARSAPTVPQIGRALGHPRQVIQRAANRLLEQGLIATVDNPDHKRANLLIATPAGSAIQAEANRKAEAISDHLLRQVDAAQLAAAVAHLEAIRGDLDAGARKAKP